VHRPDRPIDRGPVAGDDRNGADIGLVDEPIGDGLDDDPRSREVRQPRVVEPGGGRDTGRARPLRSAEEAPPRDGDPGRGEEPEALRLEQRRPAIAAGGGDDRPDRVEIRRLRAAQLTVPGA
jgi:hypothetical protein